MKEQFFWKNKNGDSIYIGYGIEKIKELKIDFSNNKELEPLIIIQYVSEDFINSMVLLKDLNNIFYIFEELDYPEINSIKKSFHESDFEKFKEIIAEKNNQDKELNNLNVILENYQLIQEINKNNNINPIKKNKI
jgi:enolase